MNYYIKGLYEKPVIIASGNWSNRTLHFYPKCKDMHHLSSIADSVEIVDEEGDVVPYHLFRTWVMGSNKIVNQNHEQPAQ